MSTDACAWCDEPTDGNSALCYRCVWQHYRDEDEADGVQHLFGGAGLGGDVGGGGDAA